jgi:putative aminopeptidase FrvX
LTANCFRSCSPRTDRGVEGDVREVCRRELEPLVDEAWIDPAGNLVGVLRGGNAPSMRVMAHLDELSMIVKRVEPDGSLHVTQLGTMYPGNFGLGPVAILGGDHETICGVMTLGSEHTTKESRRIWETKPDQGDQTMDWQHVYLFTGLQPEELAAAGVQPGTRLCVHRSKRTLIEFGDYLGSYFMDDRAPAAALLQTVRVLTQQGLTPAGDLYAVFTTNEEIGGIGGSYASRTLPGELTIALEVGPAEAEYATTCSGGPIVAYSDAECVYDKAVADALMAIATERGLAPPSAVLAAFESDASHSKQNRSSARAGLLCIPTLSTHGYEVIKHDAIDAIDAMAEVLIGFLRRWAS